MKIFYSIILVLIFFNNSVYPQKTDESLIKNPPKLKEYATDETGSLTNNQLDYLRLKLRNFFDSTSTQIVVYMINTLNGEPIENVSISIAAKNKIGRKGYNNGVLLIIAKNDHKLRIEVGYGLEGAITDALSSQIIKNEISPHFKKGEYYEGINQGIDAIIFAVKGEYTYKSNDNSASTFNSILILISVFIGVIVCFGIFWLVVSFFSAKTGYISGSFGSGSSNGSSCNSSSSSDSGFSGGGGDFGGGGASGSW
jgi:uncharacterized protein